MTKFRDEVFRILSPKINQKIVGVGLVVSYSCCPLSSRFEYTFFAFPPFQRSRANTTSSIKPEVHDVSQRHRRRPRATAIRNMRQHSVKIGRGVSEICSLTNKQADRHTDTLSSHHDTSLPYRKWNKIIRPIYNVLVSKKGGGSVAEWLACWTQAQ